MNLYLRFLLMLLKNIRVSGKIDIFGACRTRFRVHPLDLDMNFHMNNGRYLTIMDLGRFDLMLKAGIFWRLLSRGYYPVVVSENIRFRKSLGLLDGFELETVIESWDEHDLFISQTFLHKDQVVARGYVKGRFRQRGRKGSMPTAEMFELAGKTFSGPRLSDLARGQSAVEAQLRQ